MLSGPEYDFRQGCTGGKAIWLGWMPHWPWWAHSWVRAVPRGIGANRANQPNHKHTNAPKSKDRHEA